MTATLTSKTALTRDSVPVQFPYELVDLSGVGTGPWALAVVAIDPNGLTTLVPATAANQPALNGDGGALAHVTNFPATQAISAVALPLAPGAATAAGLTNINTTLGGRTGRTERASHRRLGP